MPRRAPSRTAVVRESIVNAVSSIFDAMMCGTVLASGVHREQKGFAQISHTTTEPRSPRKWGRAGPAARGFERGSRGSGWTNGAMVQLQRLEHGGPAPPRRRASVHVPVRLKNRKLPLYIASTRLKNIDCLTAYRYTH